MNKPRTWEIRLPTLVVNTKSGIHINSDGTDRFHDWVLVREVVPDSVTVTREEFIALIKKSEKRESTNVAYSVFIELFGEK